ncbi:MAG TPA: IS200/IS605 family transposase [Terriglobales bacterium]|nr:IS200/IS605 family transposase [Terriglobales bacterium]
MAHSYVCVYVHIVFSTKNRQPLIPEQKGRVLWRYLAGIAKNHGLKAVAVGGMPDHVHILLSLSPEMGVAKAVNLLKSNSSKRMREEHPRFGWQEGYSAFSVSASALNSVEEYINTQPEHHKRRDFAQEYLASLKKHGVSYDPKWVME